LELSFFRFVSFRNKSAGKKKVIAQLTLLAGVSVPSTSKRQMVLAIGRWVKGGNWEAAADILELQLSFFLWCVLDGGGKEGRKEGRKKERRRSFVSLTVWLVG